MLLAWPRRGLILALGEPWGDMATIGGDLLSVATRPDRGSVLLRPMLVRATRRYGPGGLMRMRVVPALGEPWGDMATIGGDLLSVATRPDRGSVLLRSMLVRATRRSIILRPPMSMEKRLWKPTNYGSMVLRDHILTVEVDHCEVDVR
ncbi:hypothetical protein QAD02_004134 [Eretmocerus hayati]|uniref:Uncharacterized protein n=1 Tax=Eretmocerus hayati TaxID=131215 RepID=A0ACC2NPX5_9HYME|nr:hypothetical protein QAD02_004134 [Eretmocerus hayati]